MTISLDALGVAKTSADAAEKAALAAEKAADVAERALIDVNRPYLDLKITEGYFIDTPDNQNPWVSVRVENIGPQPAIIQMSSAELRYWPSGVPPKFDVNPIDPEIKVTPIVGPLVLQSEGAHDCNIRRDKISPALAGEFRRREAQLYVRIWIKYRDPLGTVRECGQTWLYVRAGSGLKARFQVQPYAESTFDRRVGVHDPEAWF